MPVLAPRNAHTPAPKSVALAIVSTVMMIAPWNSRCCASVISPPPPRATAVVATAAGRRDATTRSPPRTRSAARVLRSASGVGGNDRATQP